MWITKSIGHNNTSLNGNVQVKIERAAESCPFYVSTIAAG